jgi:phosphoheptose isomerase
MALIDRLVDIGDAIRQKNGTTEPIPLIDMPQAILDIQGGENITEEEQRLILEILSLIGGSSVIIIGSFFGGDTPEFSLVEEIGGLYAIQLSLDIALENNTVYTIIIDEGTENEITEKLFTALNEDSGMLVGLSANPNQNNIALMQVTDNEYILASLDGTLVGLHTIKILKDTNDMSENYVIRLFDNEKLDIVATGLSTDKNYTVSITNSSGGLLYSDNETFETTSGMFGMVDYDIDRGEIYDALSSGEKCTLQIIDNSDNSVVISSSNAVKSQVTFMGGTVCECYCWGNENIIPYTSFGT